MRLRFCATCSSSLLGTAMSSRPHYRGGRNIHQRGFSDAGTNQFVSGDTHFQSVRDANRGPGRSDHHSQPQFNSRFSHSEYRPPHSSYHPNQAFRPPNFYNNLKQQLRTPQQHHHFLQNQQSRPQFRNQKPLDYRNWEFARMRPSPHSDRFTVLSYNILADYLAIDHQGKLYFHVPRYMMDWEWRKKNILFELGLWSADILCFQEVDRFQELEEELKIRGYCGTWKMRTGNPLDGCAIFWRSSRFKLLHEESIEFNKLGLRDNVAQICVLERISPSQNDAKHKSAIPASTGGSSKVVVGNTHVLYNPRRGEIKLGQVRVLLDRVHAVSKLWDDAPVVLCGDFNCTPKSPLYNFISEQELDLSDLPRDKLSGQASAEIRSPRSFTPNLRSQTGNAPTIISDRENRHFDIPTDDSPRAPTDNRIVGQHETSPNMQKNNGLDSNNGTVPNQRDLSLSHCINSVPPDSSGLSNDGGHNDEKVSANDEADVCHDKEESDFHIKLGSLNECQDMHYVQLTRTMHQPPVVHFHHEDKDTDMLSTEQVDLNKASDVSCNELHQSNLCDINDSTLNESSKHVQSLSLTNENNLLPTSHEIKIPNSFTSNGRTLDDVEDDSSDKVTESTQNRTPSEDAEACLSGLHGELHVPSEAGQISGSNPSECIGSTDYGSISEFGPNVGASGMEFNQVGTERTAYDPSAWTPMEIETATGCADSTIIESPLKLKSTYTEVEDFSGTRDSNGEPMVTSYNRCFQGTVDYIWRSEGLQTVRVLAPIPKHVMQQTDGFPTKKWGSDHIALVSELAFTKGIERS